MKRRKRRKKNFKFKLLLFLIIVILFVFLIDKFTGNNISNYISNVLNNQLIKKNPHSLILSIQSKENQITTIPIISYDNIHIDWGDGNKDEYKSYKVKRNNPNSKENIYDDIIIPAHKYSKKGNYKIIITGDTNRGFFGYTKHTTIDNFGKNMFKKEFLTNIPVYTENMNTKNDLNNNLKEYLLLNNEKNENLTNENKTFDIQKIISFKNLNFKGLGILTNYFESEINLEWIEEFKEIEIFIESFANSTITQIPSNLFDSCSNLRILSATFFACNKLESIPDNLIKDFKNVENIRYCFSNSENIKGLAPLWWINMITINKISDVENLPYLLCFNECVNLDNYNEIPFFWGGIMNLNN